MICILKEENKENEGKSQVRFRHFFSELSCFVLLFEYTKKNSVMNISPIEAF